MYKNRNKNNNLTECEELNHLRLGKELLFKILVIGDFGVGKTSIIKRYAEGTFSPTYKITIGADFALKTINWDNYTRINLQLWDIAGHERFGYLTGVYYRYAVAATIVFDLTRIETFNSVKKWLLDLHEKVRLPNGEQVPVILLANKGDVDLSDIPSRMEEFCKENDILAWLITSAKENKNIDEAMNLLLQTIVKNHENLQEYNNQSSIKLNDDEINDKKMECCWL